jgi:hypothetical protein
LTLLLEAGRLKREIKAELNVTPKMSFAGTGVLDVVLDGTTIFSYQEKHRLPGRGEIAGLIQAAQPS